MGLVSTWVSSTDVVGVKGWTGVKGVRDAKELSLLRGVGLRDGLVVPVAGVVVASMEWCPTRHVVLRRVLVRWSISVYQAVVISPV